MPPPAVMSPALPPSNARLPPTTSSAPAAVNVEKVSVVGEAWRGKGGRRAPTPGIFSVGVTGGASTGTAPTQLVVPLKMVPVGVAPYQSPVESLGDVSEPTVEPPVETGWAVPSSSTKVTSVAPVCSATYAELALTNGRASGEKADVTNRL